MPIRNGLASAYYQLREQYQSPFIQIVLLEKASALQPSNSKCYRELSDSYILLNKRTTALPFPVKAIDLKPTDPYLHLRMAVLLDSFVSLREVPSNYEPWKKAIGQQLKASMALFPVEPTVHAEVCKLLLKRWNYLDEAQRQTVLFILRKTLEIDNGKHSEAVLEALWDASKDISLVRNAIPESSKRYERLNRIVEKLENSDENIKENTAN